MDEFSTREYIRTRPETRTAARQLAVKHEALTVQACIDRALPYFRVYNDKGEANQPGRAFALEYAMSRVLTDPNTTVGRHFLCDWGEHNDPRNQPRARWNMLRHMGAEDVIVELGRAIVAMDEQK